MADNEQFVQRHIELLLAGDLDQVMQNYQSTAVLRAGDEEYRGAAAVRRHLEDALASAPSDSRLDYEIKTQSDDQVMLIWRLFVADSPEPVMHGYDEFRFDGGRIAEQFVAIAGH
ncbi:MAG: nuclear transport factor 2 family protein [Acidimicrobiales bacterium]